MNKMLRNVSLRAVTATVIFHHFHALARARVVAATVRHDIFFAIYTIYILICTCVIILYTYYL
jgi:hypothetical protein